MSASPSPAIRIRRGMASDARELAEFGRRIFTETFGADNRPEDMAAYLAQTYGEPQQRAELTGEENTFLIAERGGRIVGYAFVRPGTNPAGKPDGARELELARFYIDGSLHGTGAARTLMDRVVSETRARGATSLWLGVFEKNPRAIRFYEKCGFRDVGGQFFTVGTDVQRDRVMRREIDAAPRAREANG